MKTTMKPEQLHCLPRALIPLEDTTHNPVAVWRR
jgi:hypothetical protein